MIPQKIGNWLIDDDGIKWDGVPKHTYEIAKNRITEERDNMFDWLVHMPEKTWLTKEDIYALNTAFIFAIEKFRINIPSNLSFVETFKTQELVLKNK